MSQRMHRSLRITLGLSGLLLVSIPIWAHGQAVVENNHIRLEIIGLKRWSTAMIQDSLAVYAPSDSLLSHACASILVDKLHFADADVMIFPPSELDSTSKETIIVTVLEPQDSALIQKKHIAGKSLQGTADWSTARSTFKTNRDDVELALQVSGFWMNGDTAAKRLNITGALPLKSFLKRHESATDLREALWALNHDSNFENRRVAALILRGFGSKPSAWRGLMNALRDPDWRVVLTASYLLHSLQTESPIRVDWSSSVNDLRLLVNGTSLPANSEVLTVLSRTQISPSLAKPILGGAGGIVLAKLASDVPSVREPAYQFLRRISGHNWAPQSAKWGVWIDSL